jgi:O-antigen/teichoic acid export membrane protein
MIVGFVLTPLIEQRLGVDANGIWRFMLEVVGYSGFLQMALFAGVSRFLSRAHGAGDQLAFDRYLAVALASMLVFAVLFVAAALLLADAAADFFAVTPDRRADFTLTLRVLAPASMVSALAAILSFVPYSHERITVLNAVGAAAEIMRGIGSVVAVHAGGMLADLAWVHMATSLFSLATFLLIVRYRFPHVSIDLRLFRWRDARELYRFGAIAFVVKLGDLLRFQIDLTVIVRYGTEVAAGIYGVALQLLRNLYVAILALADVTQPRLAAIAGQPALFAHSVLRYSRVLSVLTVGFAGCAVVSLADFLAVWRHHEAASNSEVMTVFFVLLAAFVPDLMTSVAQMGLRAIDRYSVYALQNLLEGLVNLFLSVLLVRSLGIVGVAIGTAVPTFVTKVLVQPVYCCKFFGLSRRAYYWHVLVMPPLVGAMFTVTVFAAKEYMRVDNYFLIAVQAVTFLVLWALLAGRLLLTREDREQVVEFLRRRKADIAATTKDGSR